MSRTFLCWKYPCYTQYDYALVIYFPIICYISYLLLSYVLLCYLVLYKLSWVILCYLVLSTTSFCYLLLSCLIFCYFLLSYAILCYILLSWIILCFHKIFCFGCDLIPSPFFNPLLTDDLHFAKLSQVSGSAKAEFSLISILTATEPPNNPTTW